MNDVLHKLPQFLGNHPFLLALFVALVLALIVTEILRLTRKWKELTPASLTLLINRESPLVVDISAYADYEKAHIPGSRHVPPSQFDPENKELAKVRELPVVIVDKDGRGMDKAAARLVKAGFTRVHTLGGGVEAWRQAQLPLAKGKN
jgi:rhodanese-related sulfurtransferase